jgi:hypothetical protein
MVALLTALFVGGVASAQPSPYPPDEPGTIELGDASLVCGEESTTISGSGFVPGIPVDILFDGQKIGEAVPDAQGEFTTTITPPEAAAGQHTVSAVQDIGGGETIEASATLVCVAVGEIAFTGADITWGVVLLIGLLGVGGLALAIGRRRARAA